MQNSDISLAVKVSFWISILLLLTFLAAAGIEYFLL